MEDDIIDSPVKKQSKSRYLSQVLSMQGLQLTFSYQYQAD